MQDIILKPGFHVSEIFRTIGHFAVPERLKFCRYVAKTADHRRKLGRVGKIETLPIFPICPRPSDSCFYKSGNSKIPLIWDFPDI